MKKQLRAIVAVAVAALSAYGIFLLTQANKISGCELDEWPQIASFDAQEWESRSHREQYVLAIREMLRGMTTEDVKRALGEPDFVYRDKRSPFDYALGDLRLFSCKMNLHATMSIKFDMDDRVEDVVAYID